MSLTSEQQRALDELMAAVPVLSGKSQPERPDFLKTWLGFSRADLKAGLAALLVDKDGLEKRLLDWSERHPLDAAFEFLVSASLAFFLAEKDENPKIKTYVDAFYYIATCASVGYADIFAVTQIGRSVASLVMILGPALTNKALDRPVARTSSVEAVSVFGG